jgi:hypothetical protein
VGATIHKDRTNSSYVKSKRDFSTPRADCFAGAKEKKKRRLAPVGMTVLTLWLNLRMIVPERVSVLTGAGFAPGAAEIKN